ncbi:MAG TPA: SRPBCC family protein [Actinoplanes sp.]
MSMVQQAIEVSAPLHTVYEQLAAFENYPRFMSGVQEVTPIGHDQTHWIMDVDGKRREFDAQITERSLDERVAWSTTEGPLLAETITLRPMGETKTQIVAQLEADIAFLMPSDRHGQASLTRRLKTDLTTFKSLVEGGLLGEYPGGASSKMIVNPASVAARIRNRAKPGAGWGTSAAERSNGSDADLPYHGLTEADMGTNVDITSAPGISSAHDLDDVLAPGRRIAKAGPISGGPISGGPISDGAGGAARMGGRTPRRDAWGDGMINEEERGSAHDM